MNERSLVFLLIISVIILGLIAWKSLFWFQMTIYTIFSLFMIGSFTFIFIKYFVIMLGDYERAIIFRLGKFNRVGGPGWTILIPFIEKAYKIVDVRIQVLSIPEVKAFTKNDIVLDVSATSFFRITDPYKAVLRVQEYERALKTRLVGQIRNNIGLMMLREVFARIDLLNEVLKSDVNKIAISWGILVEKVEILQIKLPDEVVKALYKPLTEEQRMIATRFIAEARKIVIEAIGEAAKALDDRGITVLYLKALEQIAKGKATKIIFPLVFVKFLEKYADSLKGWTKEDIKTVVGAIAKNIESKED